MADEPRDAYADLEPVDKSSPSAREEPLGVVWGLVAFLLGAALLAIFVVQNTEQIRVEFLFWDVTMSIGVVIMVVVLATLTFDQLINFLYRRSKRKKQTAPMDGR